MLTKIRRFFEEGIKKNRQKRLKALLSTEILEKRVTSYTKEDFNGDVEKYIGLLKRIYEANGSQIPIFKNLYAKVSWFLDNFYLHFPPYRNARNYSATESTDKQKKLQSDLDILLAEAKDTNLPNLLRNTIHSNELYDILAEFYIKMRGKGYTHNELTKKPN